MVCVRSCSIDQIDGRRNRGAYAGKDGQTRSTVPTMLAPGCRLMMIITAGLLLT